MSDSESKSGEKKLVTIKNAADLQRLKIEKLMKNPDKPVVIPERPKQKSLAAPPDFVRNVMGSSAGAGSGEFHVYRHLRRKEYARQKFIQEKSEKEKLDEEYHMKIEQNKKAAEEKTAKKRAKRLKKKKNAKLKGKKTKTSNQQPHTVSSQSDSSSEEDENEEKPKDSEKNTGQFNYETKSNGKEQSLDNQSVDAVCKHSEIADESNNQIKARNNESMENERQSEELDESNIDSA